ncbi:IS5 family transposase [Streptomyces caniferus]|uniref:IS5 family transposase n=1 Tax=Streptomyces caniferus TaxID=285557 RepID=UPI0038015A8D
MSRARASVSRLKATRRPPVDRRTVVEATAWRFRTGAPWRDLPERFGNWNGDEPADHAIGRSRGGLTTKTHLVADGKGRAPAFVLTGGQVADTIMLPDTLDEIRATGRPRQRPDRPLADKGYPSRANRAWLRERGIATTIPERDDQIAHRRKRPGRPIDFGDGQRQRYRGRNVVERCFNELTQWRGLAMRSDKTARNHHSGQYLAATPHWVQAFGNTA